MGKRWRFHLLSLLAALQPLSAQSTGTSTWVRDDFSDGTLDPFYSCTTQKPAYVAPFNLNGEPALEFFWTQRGYDGTRMDKGAEACSRLDIYKEGWFGFRFQLPSPGFPMNKEGAIAQIFAEQGCSSWAAMLVYRKNSMVLQHRAGCVAPMEPVITPEIRRNVWISVIMHFRVSARGEGLLEIWYGGAPRTRPTYRHTGNFAWGIWKGDSLDASVPDNMIKLKIGMYNFQDAQYITGEERRVYFDNVSQINGNPPDAWTMVNPDNATTSAGSSAAEKAGNFLRIRMERGLVRIPGHGGRTGQRILDAKGKRIKAGIHRE